MKNLSRFAEKTDDFTVAMDKWLDKYIPYILCFIIGYFTGGVVAVIRESQSGLSGNSARGGIYINRQRGKGGE